MPELQRMPQVINVDGGFFSVVDYGDELWVSNIVSYKRGDGNKVVRELIKYAKDRSKLICGYINPLSDGLNRDRLEKWYKHFGGEVVNGNIIRY